MGTKCAFTGVLTIIGGLCALQMSSQKAQAIIVPYVLDAGSVTFTHIADSANTGSPVATSPAISYSSLPFSSPGNFTGASGFTNTLTTTTGLGVSSTVAEGSIYQTTNSTNVGVALTGGSGVSQTNVPGEAYTGASVLDANVNLTWGLNTQFAPVNSFPGINYQFPIGGIVGIGGSDEFIATLNFYDVHGITTTLIGSLDVDHTFTNGTSGPVSFSQVISGNDALNGGVDLPSGDSFQITGDIKFRAKNDESPSGFNFTSDSTMSGAGFTTEPTGPQDSTDIETESVVPEPSAAGLGILAILVLTLSGRSLRGRRQLA